jgi:hypothetical protein
MNFCSSEDTGFDSREPRKRAPYYGRSAINPEPVTLGAMQPSNFERLETTSSKRIFQTHFIVE